MDLDLTEEALEPLRTAGPTLGMWGSPGGLMGLRLSGGNEKSSLELT